MSDRHRLTSSALRVRLRFAADDKLAALIRRGDAAAFEALYDRYAAALLSFCMYTLGSRQDAEDAVQATFASAYRSLLADERPVSPRPWLFTIARNACLSILRKRRPTAELNGEVATWGDPVKTAELREEMRYLLTGLLELPEPQRAALVLAEVHGLSQEEIGSVLGVRTDQVKAYAYQGRSHLLSDRQARETDCREIREELAAARGAALLKGRLRRHLRACPGCRAYEEHFANQRRRLAVLLPVVPSLALKSRALEHALSSESLAGGATVGGAVAAGAAELAGGGVKAVVVKVAAGMAAVGATAGVGASMLGVPVVALGHAAGGSRQGQQSAQLHLESAANRATARVVMPAGPGPSTLPALNGRRDQTGRARPLTTEPIQSGPPLQPGGPGSGGSGSSGSEPGTAAAPPQQGAAGAQATEGHHAPPHKSEEERLPESEQDKREAEQRLAGKEERERKIQERRKEAEERKREKAERPPGFRKPPSPERREREAQKAKEREAAKQESEAQKAREREARRAEREAQKAKE